MKLSPYWQRYDKRCLEYENQGMTRSDAQAVVDAELLGEEKRGNKALSKAYWPKQEGGIK